MSDVNSCKRSKNSIIDDLMSSLKKLESSSFYKQFVEDMERTEFKAQIERVTGSSNDDDYPSCSELVQLVVYGVGSIAYSEVSRMQLCLALLMKRKYEWIDDVVVYDPILTSNEKLAIETFFSANLNHFLYLTLPNENENCRRRVARPTMFFMPHVSYELMNNLLEANWKVENLNKIIILGNSFSEHKLTYYDINPIPCGKVDRNKGRNDKHILGILKNNYTVEMPLPKTYRLIQMNYVPIDLSDSVWMRAFSTLSWHFFLLHDSTDLNILLS